MGKTPKKTNNRKGDWDIIQLLNVLEKKEFDAFEKFIMADFSDKSKATKLPYYEALKKAFLSSKRKNESPSTEVIEAALQKAGVIEQSDHAKIRMKLSEAIEEFLTIQELRKNKVAKQKFLLKALVNRKVNKRIGKHYNAFKKAKHSISYWRHKPDIEEYQYQLSITPSKKGQHIREYDIVYQSLETSGLILKLRSWLAYYNNIIQTREKGKTNKLVKIANELLETASKIKERYPGEYPLIDIYIQLMKWQQIPEIPGPDLSYDQLKELIIKNKQLFDEDGERRIIYSLIVSVCITQLNIPGENDFIHEILFWYKLQHEEGILTREDGKIAPISYINIIRVAYRCKEFEFAESIKKAYHFHLEQNFTEEASLYNEGTAYFYRGNYEKVAEMMEKVRKNKYDFIQSIDGKISYINWFMLDIKNLFEIEKRIGIDGYVSVESRLKAMGYSIKRLSSEREVAYSHFQQCLQSLINIVKHEVIDKDKLSVLLSKIDQSSSIVDWYWLRDQVRYFLDKRR